MSAHNKKRKLKTLAFVVAFVMLGRLSIAQTTNTAPGTSGDQSSESEQEKAAKAVANSKTDQPSEEPVVLSPFTVDTSKDEGYRATSTLAGSRINTDLKDVAAPITVLTKQFFDDLGAVGVNDVMNYVANGEGTGSYTYTNSVLGAPSDEIDQNPNTAIRLRGLQAPDFTKDYFYTIGSMVGFDTYNLDEVTISRGPNSILAGLGSPAGIINYSPQLAQLDSSKGTIAMRWGSWNDQRVTLDANTVLIKNKLALRVDGAWTDRGFKQQPAYDHDKRLYGTITYHPWEKTTIRLSAEDVWEHRDLPNNLTPIDNISQWVAVGKPTVSPPAAPANPAQFPVFDGAGYTLIHSSNGTLIGAAPENGPYFQTYSQQNLSNVPIWVPLHLSNNQYINLQDINLNAQAQRLMYRDYLMSIDQEIVKDLNLNLSYTHETYDDRNIILYRPQYTDLNIDVNQTLPTGAANPYFGQTYIDQRGLNNLYIDHDSNGVGRATLTYDLNLSKYNKWLGDWRLTGFLEQRSTSTETFNYDVSTLLNGVRTQLNSRYYLGGTLTSPATGAPQNGGLVSNVPAILSYTASNQPVSGTISSFYGLDSDNKSDVSLDTSAFVVQGSLWDDRIDGLFGIRRDKNIASSWSSANYLTPSSAGSLATVLGQTKTYGGVFHALKWLSFHYNRSENFIPNAGSIDLLGNPTAPPSGHGLDYGVSVDLFEDRLNVKLNVFRIDAKNQAANSNASFTGWWSMPWFDEVVMPALAAVNNTTYTPGTKIGVGDPRLTNGYTQDSETKGIELEATYNITKDWRVMANVSSQTADTADIASSLTAFIQKRISYYQAQGLWNGPVGGAIWGAAGTGQQLFNQWVLPDYIAYQASQGQQSQELAKWHASGLTNYSFSSGFLKGLYIGGGLRYIDKAIIGDPAILNASGAVTGLDTAHPYTVPAYFAGDVWLGYSMKVGKKYTLTYGLTVYDVEESGGFRPVYANSDGTHSVFRIVPPRRFELEAKLQY
jgi:outer membrane receptor protein involved in Fe transport